MKKTYSQPSTAWHQIVTESLLESLSGAPKDNVVAGARQYDFPNDDASTQGARRRSVWDDGTDDNGF